MLYVHALTTPICPRYFNNITDARFGAVLQLILVPVSTDAIAYLDKQTSHYQSSLKWTSLMHMYAISFHL